MVDTLHSLVDMAAYISWQLRFDDSMMSLCFALFSYLIFYSYIYVSALNLWKKPLVSTDAAIIFFCSWKQ